MNDVAELGLSTKPHLSAVRQTDANGSVCAVIVAGGSGTRFGNPGGKQLVHLCGMPLVCWSILACDRAPSVDYLIVVVPHDRRDDTAAAIADNISLRCPLVFAEAGPTRQKSVEQGLKLVPDSCEFVAVHDGARPVVRSKTVEDVIACLRKDQNLAGAIAACPSVDTLKLAEDGLVISTPDRSYYWCAQTPQVFRTRVLRAAYRSAAREDFVGTDDASLVERRGGRVVCVASPRSNLKVTLPEDLIIAQTLLEHRLAEEGCGIKDEGLI